jgi:uncharacterized protein
MRIEGGDAAAYALRQGQCLKVINLEGSQVVDCWAFAAEDSGEFLSNEHTRSCLEKLIPGVGDSLYSNVRRPIIEIVEDTSPGVHDLLLSACDIERYRLLGHVGYHKNCADNLRQAMADTGVELTEVPSPFNIFENVEITGGGKLSIIPPVVEAGQSITLKARMDITLVLSSCPMDMALTNGPDLRSKPVEVLILE